MDNVGCSPNIAFSTFRRKKRSHVKQDSVARYHVPIMYTAAFGKERVTGRVLLTGNSTEIKLSGHADWLLLNSGAMDSIGVRTATKDLATLTKDLYADLTPIERFGLLSDLWAFTLNGSLELKTFFRHSYKFKSETDKNVWTVLIAAIVYLNQVVGKAQRSSLKEYVNELVLPALEKIAKSDDKKDSKKATAKNALKEQLHGMLLPAPEPWEKTKKSLHKQKFYTANTKNRVHL